MNTMTSNKSLTVKVANFALVAVVFFFAALSGSAQQFEAQPPAAGPAAASGAGAGTASVTTAGVVIPEFVWIGLLIAVFVAVAFYALSVYRRRNHDNEDDGSNGEGLTFTQACTVELRTGRLGVNLGNVRATIRPNNPRNGFATVWALVVLSVVFSALILATPAVTACHQTAPPNHAFTASDNVAREFVCTGTDLGGIPAGNSVTFFRGGAQLPITTNVTSSSANSLTFMLSAPAGTEGEPVMKVNGYEVGKHIGVFSLYEAGRLDYALRTVKRLTPPPPAPVINNRTVYQTDPATKRKIAELEAKLATMSSAGGSRTPEEREMMQSLTALIKQMSDRLNTQPASAPATTEQQAQPVNQPAAASLASAQQLADQVAKLQELQRQDRIRLNQLSADGSGSTPELKAIRETQNTQAVQIGKIAGYVVADGHNKKQRCARVAEFQSSGIIIVNPEAAGCSVQKK